MSAFRFSSRPSLSLFQPLMARVLTVFFGALYQLDDQTVLDRPDNLAIPAPLREWWAQWNGMAYTRFRG